MSITAAKKVCYACFRGSWKGFVWRFWLWASYKPLWLRILGPVRNNDCIGSMACNGIGPQPSRRTSCAFVLHLFVVLHGAGGAWALALLRETLAASGLRFCMPQWCIEFQMPTSSKYHNQKRWTIHVDAVDITFHLKNTHALSRHSNIQSSKPSNQAIREPAGNFWQAGC